MVLNFKGWFPVASIHGGRASLAYWTSGVKACVPPALPPAAVALRAGTCEGLKKCDAGKGDECPNDPQLHKDCSLLHY